MNLFWLGWISKVFGFEPVKVPLTSTLCMYLRSFGWGYFRWEEVDGMWMVSRVYGFWGQLGFCIGFLGKMCL